jgi:L-fucose isomerase-like protein
LALWTVGCPANFSAARTGEFTAPGILTLARLTSSSDFFREFTANARRSRAIENFFSIVKKNLFARVDLERKLRRDVKNCDRARWLPEQTRAIA